MPISKPQPLAEQPSPYLPPGPEPLIFEDFESINTSNTRTGIDDKQMWWCSGFYPYGTRDLRTLPGIGPVLWTSPGPGIVFYNFANIGSLPVAIVFLADGSIYQVATTTGAAIIISGPGTIPNPSILTAGMSQWGSQYVLIVTNQRANGYFVWDGSVLYQAGSLAPGVTLTNVGSGYTSVPTVSASGGSGTGATFSVTLTQSGGITSVSVGYGGSYGQQSIAFNITGGGGTGAVLAAGSWIGGPGAWALASISVISSGSGYTAPPIVTAVTFPGNQIAQASSLIPTIASTGSVVSVTITNAGVGYAVGDTPTLSFSGGGGSGAAATVTIMPYAIQGTDIETYAQRAWLINGALLQFAAPGSFTNFSTASGGGSVTSNDSFLRVGYTRLIQTNGFLYLIGDSSINYISGVQTSGSPPTTTYTNQNADPEVGTPYPQTADVFGRNIVFANSFGVHVSYGAAVTKVSEPLDGVYNTVANFNGLQLSAAKATIFGKKTWVLLVPIIDPVTNQLSNELILWDGQKKWFSSKQDVALTFIQFQEINSVLTAWGTDGGRLFPLFNQPSINFTKTVQSKLYTRAGGYQFRKSAGRLWGIAQYNSTLSPNITVTIDNEISSAPYVISPSTTTMSWTTASGATMNWTTAGNTAMTWSTSQLGLRTFGPQAVGQNGSMLGFTASTVAADLSLVSLMMDDQITQYRG
jgi:hypothetical protein